MEKGDALIMSVLRINPDALDDEVWAKCVAKSMYVLGEVRNFLTVFNNDKF